MYFGNSNGVLEYDGNSWRLIQVANGICVRILALDKQGVVYVGAYNDFGYLQTDSSGSLYYQTLLDKVPEAYREFGDIWSIHITGGGVFFKSFKYLFWLRDDSIKVIKPSLSEFNESFLYRDTLYLEYWQTGLGKLVGDSIHLILTQSDFNGRYAGLNIMLPYDEDHALIGNSDQGLFLFDGHSVTKFKNNVDRYLKSFKLYHGVLLDNGLYAFATSNNGLVIMNRDGHLNSIIDKQSGLANNTIWYSFVDRHNSIWLALDNGISRVEFPSPLTRFDEVMGLSGTITQVLRFNNKLYLTTTNGLFHSGETQSNTPIAFKAVEGIREQAWSMVTFRDKLLVGALSGVYEIDNHKARRIRQDNSVFLLHSQYFEDRIYIGLVDGLATMHYQDGQWVDDGKIEGINEYLNNRMAETSDGKLWIGHYQGVMQLDFSDGFSMNPPIKKFDTNHGLPAKLNNFVQQWSGDLRLATKNGIYRYSESKGQFEEDSLFNTIFKNNKKNVFTTSQDDQGRIWFYSAGKLGFVIKNDTGGYESFRHPFLRLAEFKLLTIYPEQNGIVWFGGTDGLFRYDPQYDAERIEPFAVLIRNITNREDSLIFAGGGTSYQQETPAEFNYQNNSFHFEFALPCYENETSNQFQYILEKHDRNWSKWNRDNKAIYSYLPAGSYTFRVRAKNIYQIISPEAVYRFRILPPWYQTWWMYTLYFLMGAVLLTVLIKIRFYHLQQEKRALERLVNERTAEVKVMNRQLAEQNAKLQELDHLKSRFFANISHEFRTPLTLIIGPVEEMLNGVFKGEVHAIYKIILRNAKRLLRLINQLLDLSKLESGTMTMQASKQLLSPFLSAIVHSFSSLAESRQIHLQYISLVEDLELYFDPDKLEKIMYNLLSNAVKYTPEGGHITITLDRLNPQQSKMSEGAAKISIHDTGIGIPANQLAFIFNRFTQGAPSEHQYEAGSGIGLALVKELVALHHGRITVTSEEGIGSQFDLLLPLGKSHLKTSEIVLPGAMESAVTENVDLDFSDLTIQSDETDRITSKPGTEDENLILVVEDHGDVRKYICDHLRNQYHLIEAVDGQEGITKAREHVPDLIISDIMMPEVDGIELCRTLKKEDLTSHIPIILLTAKASDETKIAGLEIGADAYLIKPFNTKELEVQVKNLIDSRRRLREKFKRDILLEPTEINAESWEDQFLKKIHDIIEENISNPDFKIKNLHTEFFLSRRQFHRKIIALTDQAPGQLIRTMRLRRARQLIQKKAGNVTEIAFQVGFNNLSYFSKCFFEQFGKYPSEMK